MHMHPVPAVASAIPPLLRLTLFGTMRAEDARERDVLPRARKSRALLAVLGLAAPQPVLRAQLTGLLWSSREPMQARASLRQSLHELQAALGPDVGGLLAADRSHVALRSDGLWCDVVALQHPGPADLDVLGLLVGPLLDDLRHLDPAFDRWLAEERHRIARIARTRAEAALAASIEPASVIASAERLVAIDRAHEAGWQALIRAHLARDDRAAAVDAHGRCRSALISAGLTLSAETESLVAAARDPARAASQAVALTTRGQASDNTDARTRHGGPRIRLGVMPLRSLDPTRDDELSLGLAEEITAAFSRFRSISCISSTSLAAMGGEGADGRLALRGLDLDFVLEGTIQRGNGRIRVIARLLDMRAAGEIVWAHRFDRENGDILSLQDEIAATTVAQVDPEMLLREGARAATRQSGDPSAHELVLRAIPAIYRLERSDFLAAGRLLDTAIGLDPASAAAHAWAAYWTLLHIGQGWSDDPETATARAGELATRAVTLDAGDARAVSLAGHVRAFLHKRADEGRALHDRALALNPNLALAWCFSGLSHCYLGQHEEAIRRIKYSQLLSPKDPHFFFFDMALTMPYLMQGDYQTAAEIGRRSIELNPGFSSTYKVQLATLGFLGLREEAQLLSARLLALEPNFSIESALRRSPMTLGNDLARYAEGLRRAGLPERPSAAVSQDPIVDACATPPPGPLPQGEGASVRTPPPLPIAGRGRGERTASRE
jgi:DNA-binding SARP family transcriptional activator